MFFMDNGQDLWKICDKRWTGLTTPVMTHTRKIAGLHKTAQWCSKVVNAPISPSLKRSEDFKITATPPALFLMLFTNEKLLLRGDALSKTDDVSVLSHVSVKNKQLRVWSKIKSLIRKDLLIDLALKRTMRLLCYFFSCYCFVCLVRDDILTIVYVIYSSCDDNITCRCRSRWFSPWLCSEWWWGGFWSPSKFICSSSLLKRCP